MFLSLPNASLHQCCGWLNSFIVASTAVVANAPCKSLLSAAIFIWSYCFFRASLLDRRPMFVLVSLFLVCLPVFLLLFSVEYHNALMGFSLCGPHKTTFGFFQVVYRSCFLHYSTGCNNNDILAMQEICVFGLLPGTQWRPMKCSVGCCRKPPFEHHFSSIQWGGGQSHRAVPLWIHVRLRR